MSFTRRTLILCALLIASLTMAFGVAAREVAVSTRAFVVGNANPSGGQQNISFTVSGGEQLGVMTPMRAYISVDGSYEGNGSLVLRLDGDSASDQIYVLPQTTTPIPLSLVLGDRMGKLAHTTAGTYNHTLTLIPTGVTLSGLSAHVTNSYTREVGGSCPDGAPNTEKMKTVEFFIAESPSLSGVTTFPINYSVNDNITGVSGSIASVYVEMVGLYEGGGPVSMYFNGLSIDGVVHTFVPSSSPTGFTVISLNAPSTFQHATAGSYTQNITIDPGAVTLENISLKLVLTYRYHPAQSSCGGFPPTGEAQSGVLDTETPSGVLYNSFTWRGRLGGVASDKGKVRFQLATAPCSNGATNPPLCSIGSWSYVGGPTCSASDWFETSGPNIPFDIFQSGCSSAFDGKQFYRYKVQLCAEDCLIAGPSTPTVDELFVSWSP